MPAAIDWSMRGMLHLVTITPTPITTLRAQTREYTVPRRLLRVVVTLRTLCRTAPTGLSVCDRTAVAERRDNENEFSGRLSVVDSSSWTAKPPPHHKPGRPPSTPLTPAAGMPTQAVSWMIVTLQQCSTAFDTLTENDCWRSHCCSVNHYLSWRSLRNLHILILNKELNYNQLQVLTKTSTFYITT